MFYAWFAFVILTAIAAGARGRSVLGWLLLGFVFGIFALILVLILPNRKQDALAPTPKTHLRCPDCQELVQWEARKCKHCGCRLMPPPRESDRWAFFKSKP
jgi:hypothetical protein